MKAAKRAKPNNVEPNSDLTQSRLNRLERHEWWRWSMAFVVMLALTAALFVLSLPAIGGRSRLEQTELNIALRGLLALVLLFDIFVVYQQVMITKLRRELATQLRVATILETFKQADGHEGSSTIERRQIRRSDFDRRVRLNTVLKGKPTCIYGRIKDISPHGMGAVIPGWLPINEQVSLEFSLQDGREGTASAVVRHRSGFRYGFDFISIDTSLAQDIVRHMENSDDSAQTAQSPHAENTSGY